MQRAAIVVLALASSFLIVPASVNASPITIDLTNGALYGSLTGVSAGPIVDQGIPISITSTGGTLTQSSEGVGVNGSNWFQDPGEVGEGEQLNFTFPTTTLYSFGLQQFFPNELFGFYTEKGQYSVNGGAWTNFSAISTLGTLQVSFGPGLLNVNSLGFRAPGFFDDYSVAQFSVEELSKVQQTPEPASMLLLGTGLAAAAARRYRSRKPATR